MMVGSVTSFVHTKQCSMTLKSIEDANADIVCEYFRPRTSLIESGVPRPLDINVYQQYLKQIEPLIK